jgi:murein DD-endopeptidase MepM/ murein hydrolase activator NlpD
MPLSAWRIGIAGGLIGFVAGVMTMIILASRFPTMSDAAVDAGGHPIVETRPSRASDAPPVVPPPRSAAAPPSLDVDPVSDLRRRDLEVPVQGIDVRSLHSNFDEERGGSRKHEALDILAPRNTPVLAVEDGMVAKLFTSKAGGLTIYQFDPTSTYVYYYAHLERYADGLKERAPIRRDQVIGYVGTSGNAPKDTPHLHFAIFKMTAEKRWWEGAPIDPYKVLSESR